MSNLLEIKDLYANVGEKEILKGLNLKVKKGEIHVIMGPNGAGKSTLANVIFNNPVYTKKSGVIEFEGENINNCSSSTYSITCFLNSKILTGFSVILLLAVFKKFIPEIPGISSGD